MDREFETGQADVKAKTANQTTEQIESGEFVEIYKGRTFSGKDISIRAIRAETNEGKIILLPNPDDVRNAAESVRDERKGRIF